MPCALTQHLICVQVGLLTAAIITTTLKQMRVNTRYFWVRQLYTSKRTHFCLAVLVLKCWLTDQLLVTSKRSEEIQRRQFFPQIKDLKRLLRVFHLQQNDKETWRNSNPKGGSQAINTILADIYGPQYSTMIDYGLVDSKDTNDLSYKAWITQRKLGKQKKIRENRFFKIV